MRITLFFLTLLTASVSFAQMRPIGKVYITEGIVIDRETSKVVSSAVLYNDSLGIMTTSDENGYFKIVVPYELVKDGRTIPIDIVKNGYKRNGSGFSFNPEADTTESSREKSEVYGLDVKVFYMAKSSSSLSSTVGANAPARQGAHGASMVGLTYNEMLATDRRQKKFDELKQGNENVYFPLDGAATGLATRLYDLIVIGNLRAVYIDGKKTKLTDINKRVKRSTIFYDQAKSDALSKAYRIETIALRTTPPPGLSKERMNADMKASLEIDLNN